MYDILIVDDEPAARKSLEYLLDWEKHGFQIAGEAASGSAALELMGNQSFSLVITDIRMPGMDGLALAERIKETTDVPVIIVSGYEDFEYARKAVRIGVHDYLLKPVEAEELAAKLSTVKRDIENRLLTEQRLYHALPIMRDQWLRHWAHGVLDDAGFVQKLELSIPSSGEGRFSLMLIELDAPAIAKYEQRDQELRIRRFAVRNVVEEACKSQGLVFEESDLRYGLIWMGTAEMMEMDALLGQARTIRETVMLYAKESVSVSVGPSVGSFQELVHSYLSALKVLEERPIHDREPILQGSGLDWKREPQAKQNIEQVKELVRKQFHQNINLRLIAGQIYMNPTYLGQLFKIHEGVSFQQYLLKLRMEHAKELLQHTDKKVYEIAAEVGYREMDWFYKKFREYEGKSPGEYRGES